jgi:hypothetical protein
MGSRDSSASALTVRVIMPANWPSSYTSRVLGRTEQLVGVDTQRES